MAKKKKKKNKEVKIIDFKTKPIIYVTNSGMVVHPCNKIDIKPIIEETSMYDRIIHSNIEMSGFYYNDHYLFATHQMKDIQHSLPYYEIKVIKPNQSTVIPDVNFIDGFELKEIQKEKMYELISSKESRIFLQLETSYGKTIVGIYYALKYIQRNTLIICFNCRILEQWREKILAFTDLPEDKIISIVGSAQCDKLLKKEATGNVYLCTPTTLCNYAKKDPKRLNELISHLGIGLKIIDEAHMHMKETIKIDALTNVAKTLYLSADIIQADRAKNYFYRKMMSCVRLLNVELNVMKELMYTTAVIVKYNTHPTSADEMSMMQNRGFNLNLYMEYQIQKGVMMKVILQLLHNIESVNVQRHKVLILVNKIDHVDLITARIKKDFGKNYTIGRYHSNCDQFEKSTIDDCDIIVSTYQSFSTGMDINGNKIRFAISCNQVNCVVDNQAAGRMRQDKDLNALYFMLIDQGFKYSMNKLNNRLNYLIQHKINKISNLDLKI